MLTQDTGVALQALSNRAPYHHFHQISEICDLTVYLKGQENVIIDEIIIGRMWKCSHIPRD